MANLHWHWLRFWFQLPKDLILELTGKHFSFSEPISWYLYLALVKDLCTGYGALSFSLNVTLHLPIWKSSWNMRNPNYFNFWIKINDYPKPYVYVYIQRLLINHQKCWLGRHPALKREVLFKMPLQVKFRLVLLKFCFSFYIFKNRYPQPVKNKYTSAIGLKKVI